MNKNCSIEVSGPSVDTSCVILCIKNIISAEMWAEKTTIN